MKFFWDNIINQQKVKDKLEKIFFSELKPTTFLFTGRMGVGKEALALAYTQSLNCEKQKFYPCGTCEACLAVANLDIRFVNFILPLPKAQNEDDIEEPFERFKKKDDEEPDPIVEKIKIGLEKKK